MGTASMDSFFHLWMTQDKKEETKCLKSFKTHTLPITTFDWSIHEQGLVGDAGSDYSIFLWNFVTE
jgi:WD40 repeat protein